MALPPPDKQHEFTSLIPEEHLLLDLSPLWKKRFDKAVSYIQTGLSNALEKHEAFPVWQDIAEHCAISQHHFLRMFSLVFGETPGQYLTRKRMQWALFLLIDDPTLPVSNIADYSGYSSSQALGKALKRELNLTAKNIRQLSIPDQEKLIQSLGHPQKSQHKNVEESIALNVPFEILTFESQHFVVYEQNPPSLLGTMKLWHKVKPANNTKLYSFTPVKDIDKPLAEQRHLIGYEVSNAQAANLSLKPASFLTCHVTINNESAYLSLWDAIYRHILTNNIEPNMDNYSIEIVHNPDSLLDSKSYLTMLLPILV